MGEHYFTYGFIAHQTLREAEEAGLQLAYPLRLYPVKAGGEELNSEFISIDRSNIQLDAFKLPEDSSESSLIIRVHDQFGMRTSFTVHLPFLEHCSKSITKVSLVNILEEPEPETEDRILEDVQPTSFSVTLSAFKFQTFKIEYQ
jgi:hypothetical protein